MFVSAGSFSTQSYAVMSEQPLYSTYYVLWCIGPIKYCINKKKTYSRKLAVIRGSRAVCDGVNCDVKCECQSGTIDVYVEPYCNLGLLTLCLRVHYSCLFTSTN